MPIDVEKAMSTPMKEYEFEYAMKDVLLYALGIGAGDPPLDKNQLKFTFENGLKTLPTFGVVPLYKAISTLLGHPGMKINPMMMLHGEQFLEIRKNPIPIKGKLTNKPGVKAVYDKGKGALVLLDCTTYDEKGEELFYNVVSLFMRGEGGFGGDSGPKAGYDAPNRPPDKVVEMKTLERQALIFRLSGDMNPLHADPQFAAMGGFPKPILHGLCTFGFVGRAVLENYCDFDPAKFKSISVRFAKHVFPGETIVVDMWKEAEDTIIFKAKTAERGEDVITNAAVKLNA